MKGEWKRRSENGAAVVFVHGALSSGEACWQNANGTYWPSLLENEPSTEKVGIDVFTFRTNIFSGTYRLGDVVDALKEHMRADGVFDCHKLVFVAHSIGGLVVRKLLVERVTDFRDKHISVGLFLVASPSLGSRYANMLKPLARFLGHSQADALRFSRNNAWLMDLDKEFTNLQEAKTIRLAGQELVEDIFIALPGLIRTQVVKPSSGAKYFGESLKVPGSDHFSIAKPDSSQAVQHQLLLRFIAEMSTHEEDRLPLEEELRERLEIRLRACKEGEVPFRTFHKLAALLAMRSGFAWSCFEAAGQGSAGRIERWLREVILAHAKKERGQGVTIGSLDADLSIASAALIARQERASHIDQRHLLLALLADKNTGTMSEIAKSLSATRRESIQAAAETGRPRELHPVCSAVPSLTREEE
jgi:predicted alpha/beta hydrolase family esterase